jgi:hypothetical protein
MRLIQHAVSLSVLFASIQGQQVGSLDLTQPLKPAESAEKEEKTNLPEGCKTFSGGGIADGWVEPEEHQLREIEVSMISVSDMKPTEGSELQAEVLLRNIGKQSIQIPWSTDRSIIRDGQDSHHLNWEAATFRVLLGKHSGNGVLLESSTRWVYGSKFSAGSLLTIQPGDWISATVKFKLVAMYLYHPGEFGEGESQFLAEWKQVGRAWDVRDCGVWNGYFQYDHFYEQTKLPLRVQITGKKSADVKKIGE